MSGILRYLILFIVIFVGTTCMVQVDQNCSNALNKEPFFQVNYEIQYENQLVVNVLSRQISINLDEIENHRENIKRIYKNIFGK